MNKQNYDLNQTQKIFLNQNMINSLDILSMSNQELCEYLNKKIIENPFLEYKKINNGKNISYQKTSNSNYRQSNNTTTATNYLENIAKEKSLKEYITEQINLSIKDQKQQIIAFTLLNFLKNDGYVDYYIDYFKQQLKCDEEIIIKTLKYLQSFNPMGVFSRNLNECLTYQLKDKNIYDKIFEVIINNLGLIAKNDTTSLQKIINKELNNISEPGKIKNITLTEVKQYIAEVKKLNPKPGNGFNDTETIYNTADIIISIEEENITIESNDYTLPIVTINYNYINDDHLSKANKHLTNRDKNFIKNNLNEAKAILRNINSRKSTLMQIATEIINNQKDFFTKGLMYFKQMSLSDIAKNTGFNQSTISRATSKKYMQTPIGTFELKYFFSSKLSTIKESQDNISSTKVKEIIKQIISEEKNVKDVNSDQSISEQLKIFNIDIARRTVAKYRQEMDISPASTRKNLLR
ncbi:MAG TPA: RNA polymerase factor sigma-54 [Candidatus Megaira endosymbiont of Hartmannula sinica]|nr:RNA polymerase factor sigma-54 [Candidatus Megaera endosymbiont of Hartmannula sinica]